MRKLLFLMGLSIFGSTTFAQQVNQKLSAQIDSLYMVDQLVQQDIINAYQAKQSQSVIDSLNIVKEESFKRHVSMLKAIISKNGLPTYNLVGKQSSDNFLVMVNHSFYDIAFQKQVIELATKQIKKKNISGNQIALLTDKMLIKSGKKQIYGTQCTYKNGSAFAEDIEDEKNVDKRRQQVGLGSLSDYLKMMTELHQQMNKKS